MDIETNDSLGDGDVADDVGDTVDELCAVAHQSIFTNNVALFYSPVQTTPVLSSISCQMNPVPQNSGV